MMAILAALPIMNSEGGAADGASMWSGGVNSPR